MFMFMAGDIEEHLYEGNTKYNEGKTGMWRNQKHTRLNGLVMLDFDDMETPPSQFYHKVVAPLVEKLGVLFAHVTPKGKGLRLVCIADEKIGNLADNQKHIAEVLGLKNDDACKDSSRGSFVCTSDDILYLDNRIFNYQNDEYDKKYGESYRTRGLPKSLQKEGLTYGDRTPQHPLPSEGDGGMPDGGRPDGGRPDGGRPDLDRNENGEYVFKGVPFKTIIDEYWKQDGGRPAMGERHPRVLSLAARLRYICENQPENLLRVIDGCGLPQPELEDIVTAACSSKMAPFLPPRMRAVLKAVVPKEAEGSLDFETAAQIDYQGYWNRLRPLLTDGFIDAVATLPDEVKMGGVLAAGAMFGTYLTRCYWEHYDGEQRRLSFLVYIIGDAASGKSFIVYLDRLIMEPMISADRAGREWERQYSEDKQQRQTSSTAQRKAAQEIKHPVIRYVPSTISNAKLYRRLTDAVEDWNGEPLHLHLYTCEAELATALRSQVGSWAGKLDLECKSFQNEYAGVDYQNEQSVNGIIQVNWNQVISGTPDAMLKKIKPSTVLDGLVTRLALFVMPRNDFQMIDRKNGHKRDHEAEARLRAWGYKLEKLSGELECEKLVDAAYKWCADRAAENDLEDDKTADYFRKRVPMYIVRYGLVHAVLRDYHYLAKLAEAQKPLKLRLNKSDIDFGLLIGDFIYDMQIRQYGQMVEDALKIQNGQLHPRKRKSKAADEYNKLPEIFSLQNIIEKFNVAEMTARMRCFRWEERGWIERHKKGMFKKVIKNL